MSTDHSNHNPYSNDFLNINAFFNILLVEDNEDDIILIRDSLEHADFKGSIRAVHDGEQALAYLQRKPPYQHVNRPTLILLDINLPKMNGLELLEHLKNESSMKSIPVVMVTTSKNETDIERSFAAGACSYLSKSIIFKEFSETIKAFVKFDKKIFHNGGRE